MVAKEGRLECCKMMQREKGGEILETIRERWSREDPCDEIGPRNSRQTLPFHASRFSSRHPRLLDAAKPTSNYRTERCCDREEV